MDKFKPGDFIIGKFHSPYGVTGTGVVCRVRHIITENDQIQHIRVDVYDECRYFFDTFPVCSEYFDKFIPKVC